MSDYITEFLDAKAVEEGAALNTLQAYRNDISQFVAAISPVAVTEVKTEDIEKYLKKEKIEKSVSNLKANDRVKQKILDESKKSSPFSDSERS